LAVGGLRYELQVCGSCINVEKDEDEEDDRSVLCVFAEPFNYDENCRIEEVDNEERPKPNNLIYKICFGESSYLKAEDACSQVEDDRNDEDYIDDYV